MKIPSIFLLTLLVTVNARTGGNAVYKVGTTGIPRSRDAFRRNSRHISIVHDVAVKAKSFAHSILSKSTPQSLLTDAPPRVSLRQGLSDAQDEIQALRVQVQHLRKQLEGILGQDTADTERRIRDFEKIGDQVEAWAEHLLFHESSTDDSDGWTEVKCNKMLSGRYNKRGNTKAFLKWMKDSRNLPHDQHVSGQDDEDQGNDQDDSVWPCIRMYSTIDAPIEQVCLYLSQEQNLSEYNQLIAKHKDLEELTPNAKICWGQSPKILFVQPRDFVTFCRYKWKDGKQIIINQACDFPGTKASAFALRGATFLEPDADDPDKTRIAMIAHASPGKDIPTWACKTAINTLVPIEPYKLFHKLNTGIQNQRQDLQETLQQKTQLVKSGSYAPAGIAQFGYAAFWPNAQRDDLVEPTPEFGPDCNPEHPTEP